MKITSLLLLFVFTVSANCEIIYITQSGAGNGSSLVNAASVSFFNTSANWGTGAGKISAGDTVILNGTITSQLVIQSSGSSGSPIVVQFAAGAKMSAPYWGSAGAIAINSKSYITVDGGSNGIIESTANGTALANQVENRVIVTSGSCTGVTIQNLTINGTYVRTPNSADSNEYGRVLYLLGSLTNFRVTNVSITDSFLGVFYAYSGSPASSNIEIDNCTTLRTATGIVFGSGGASSFVNGGKIHHNTILGGGATWDGSWGPGLWHHSDGIHVWALQGSAITGLEIYNNKVGPDLGTHVSGWIYLEGTVTSPKIYNNVCYATGNSYAALGMIAVKQNSGTTSTGAQIYNNTLRGIAIGSAGGNGIYIDSATSVMIRNNIISQIYAGIYAELAAISTSNNNLFDCSPVAYVPSSGFKTSLATWQSFSGKDVNSVFGNPLFSSAPSNLTLSSGSPAIGIGGDLSTVFTTDYNNASRTIPWDIGAYKYGGIVPPALPTCTLTAQNSTITAGQSTSLIWTTANATSVSINQGIGTVGPTAGGSIVITPATTTTYTLSANGPGGGITCVATVTVTPIPPPPVQYPPTPTGLQLIP